MKKILFLIHDLGPGGAEKVLVNLVNGMDPAEFQITVMALFGGGVNEAFLSGHVRLIRCHSRVFPGNSHVMKCFSPRWLYRHYIREDYDIVVSFLEGPCARIVSGCPNGATKTVAWIHSTPDNLREFSVGFRNPKEAARCYKSFDCRVFVSADIRKAFETLCPDAGVGAVLYNVNETEHIRRLAGDAQPQQGEFVLCGVGKLNANKGFDRLLRIHQRLRQEGYPLRTRILGEGPMRKTLENWIAEQGLSESVELLGYQTNPYPYVAGSHLFVCASHSEGFSTAATEALILGTPVCTVQVAGMEEMLGADSAYGLITQNSEDALCAGIRSIVSNPELWQHYRRQASLRGADFQTRRTVEAVQDFLRSLL